MNSLRKLCSLSFNARISSRFFSNPSGTTITSSASPTPAAPKEVPGLSENCLKVPSKEVGPGASKGTDYKNPEYFCYDKTSYFEAEIEMSKFRLPQPSSTK